MELKIRMRSIEGFPSYILTLIKYSTVPITTDKLLSQLSLTEHNLPTYCQKCNSISSWTLNWFIPSRNNIMLTHNSMTDQQYRKTTSQFPVCCMYRQATVIWLFQLCTANELDTEKLLEHTWEHQTIYDSSPSLVH
jgi:hypothetical protein